MDKELAVASTVADVMTRNPATIEAAAPVGDAARLMRQHDTGVLIVTVDGQVDGVITDRDITIRVVAEDKPSSSPVSDAYSSGELATVGPDTSIEQATQLMRSKAVRRLPVVEGESAVGIVSIGDLAIERDSDSALADISAAPGNE